MSKRGCGFRIEGGAYWSLGFSSDGDGRPVEDFLIDPPIPIDLDIPPRGMLCVPAMTGGTPDICPHTGRFVYNFVDWISAKDYLNVADFIEEVRRLGLSRRMAVNSDWDKLTPSSRLILVHKRGHIDNMREWVKAGGLYRCPRQMPDHTPENGTMCTGVYWSDVQGGESLSDNSRDLRVTRRIQCGETYTGKRSPDGFSPEYKAAIFAAFPLGKVEVVAGDSGEHIGTMNRISAALEQVRGSKPPVEVVND